jgi:hypothetical protein
MILIILRCTLTRSLTASFLIFLSIMMIHDGFAMTLDDFQWKSRILLVNTLGAQAALTKEVHRFIDENICDIDERNLKVFFFDNFYSDGWEDFPLEAKEGIWLIGYDGGIKDYSVDGSLLHRLFSVIDGMPMRRAEMNNNSACEE